MDRIKSLPVLLKNPRILLIGGGNVALQKARVLTENEIYFSVISMTVNDDFKELRINYTLKKFELKDADNFDIIINATGNPEVNELIKIVRKKRFILLNTVDVPDECDFYFSSLLRLNNLKIAVSSDGASPVLTQIVRDHIKKVLPIELKDLAEQKLFERESGIIDIERTKEETEKIFGKVFLIGCGPGDAELLTIKAHKAILSSDVVLYDNLISKEILKIIPGHIEKVFVGKSKGCHSIEQGSINLLMLEYANKGLTVGRLKNGDPFIFGHGAEEVEYLVQNNINVEVIPGISSAFGAPLNAGIPPTARGYASSVSVVTAHLNGGVFDDSWIDLLNMKNHTTIVLMGLTQVENIISNAFARNVRKDLPAVIISNATRKNQKVIVTTIENLVEDAKEAVSPAVLVFGEVVNFKEMIALMKRKDKFQFVSV
jgi:uroporphyrin-III C-methyltransferase/precorrin-2 dehydrogenase/sirohydrochlorin ferrochelatase